MIIKRKPRPRTPLEAKVIEANGFWMLIPIALSLLLAVKLWAVLLGRGQEKR